MRQRFEAQYSFSTLKIEDTKIDLKSRDRFDKLLLSLKKLYTTPEYRDKIFDILDKELIKPKQNTGRKGLNLWQIFVLGQVRLCLNITYDHLHNLVNNHKSLRQLLGIATAWDVDDIKVEYQNIVDNVKLLTDSMLKEINDLIVTLGHEQVFKKKEAEALRLKTDSFVVKSNVHFPTDYNLLWDSARKITDCINKLNIKHDLKGWRKLKDWKRELKSLMREVSLSKKKSKENQKAITENYLKKAALFLKKTEKTEFPLETNADLSTLIEMEYYISMLKKHIDLFERRVIKGQKIPHSEKVFSIFEPYTEWINKGKTNPNFELGKNLAITTDQYHLIIDYQIYENQTDKEVIIEIVQRLLNKYGIIDVLSLDKGFFSNDNKELLSMFINKLILPKKGKLNKKEYREEHTKEFKQLRNKHSAVESNINELEHRGLDRCPDRGYDGFKRYTSLAVCAYNLHKIGAELQRQENAKKKKKNLRQVA